jgi:hypothetical protein
LNEKRYYGEDTCLEFTGKQNEKGVDIDGKCACSSPLIITSDGKNVVLIVDLLERDIVGLVVNPNGKIIFGINTNNITRNIFRGLEDCNNSKNSFSHMNRLIQPLI